MTAVRTPPPRRRRWLPRRARWRWLEIAFWVAALRRHLAVSRQASDAQRDRDPRPCSRCRSISPGLCRHRLARPRAPSSASAPIPRACSPSTASSASRCWPAVRRRWRGGVGYVTSFLVLRGSDLTRLMVTLGVALICAKLANRYGLAHRRRRRPAGRRHRSRCSGLFVSISTATPPTSIAWACCSSVRAGARIVYSPFGLSLRAIKGNPLRAAAIGIPVKRRLARSIPRRGLCRHRRRAAGPDHAFVSLDCSRSIARPT